MRREEEGEGGVKLPLENFHKFASRIADSNGVSNASFPFSWHDSLDVGKVYDRLRVKVVKGARVRARAHRRKSCRRNKKSRGKKIRKVGKEKENC